MAGFKGRLKQSIQLRLSFALSVAILVVALIAGVFAFMSAFDEAHELQDEVLRAVAQVVKRQGSVAAAPASRSTAEDADEEAQVFVQALADPVSGVQDATDQGIHLPLGLPDGLQTVTSDGESFRILVIKTDAGARVAVGQETGFRDQIARDSALRTVMPFLLLVPVLLLIVADLVRKMFRPIATLSGELDQRTDDDLRPIEVAHLPSEVKPFAVAINRLLERVKQAMAVQRRFVADAAHELRSPLTALSIQAERLEDVDMPPAARERVAKLRQGIERGRALLEQLLSLARLQAGEAEQKKAVSVQAVFRCVLEDLMPLAEAKQIDLGVEGLEGCDDVQVSAVEADLVVMIKNLVDNAIRYSPAHGCVDLGLVQGSDGVVIEVRDNGPGIPLAERSRVFDPFYRILGTTQQGSGLGLSIVQTISRRLGAEVQMDYADEAGQSGLRVRVKIPL